MIAETGVVPTSCSPWAVWPTWVSRSRIVVATNAAPASVPSTRRAAGASSHRHREASRARTVKVGAIPVSSDGWPKLWPGSSTDTTWPWCTSSIEPAKSTHNPSAGRPSSTSTISPAGHLADALRCPPAR